MTDRLNRLFVLGLMFAAAVSVAACSPEVGSPEWCEDMEAKSKSDWTANEATDYAKHCLL